MQNIIWTEAFSVGHPFVDQQHKKLVEIINNLNEAINQGKGPLVTEQSLDAMVEYARQHFLAEESVIANKLDPDLLHLHQMGHDVFLEHVHSLQQAYKEGKPDLEIVIMEYLINWLTNHILGSDKQDLG